MLKKIGLSSLIVILIFLIALILRFWNLGYSDYQGDEIKALFTPEENENSWSYLLDQRKGPNQFLVTWAVRNFSDNYQNYFIVRLPFAFAGFLSVVVFYLIARKIFNKKIALISSVFFATNGFLVALSRIVQYQSFVILFGLLSIYLYLMFRERAKIPYLYGIFALLAISILFHYDGVFFGVFVGILVLTDLFWKFWREKTKQIRANLEETSKFAHVPLKKLLRHLLLSSLVFIFLIASFYIPFILNLSEQTLNYWSGRITGNVSTKVSSSYYLFQVYQPIYAVHFYTLFSILGLVLGIYPIFTFLLLRVVKTKLPKLLSDPINWRFVGVLIWFLVAFLFMEVLVSVPGTHVYTYLVPLMIVMGFGIGLSIDKLSDFFKGRVLSLFRFIYIFAIIIVGTFLFLQSWTIYVDHNKEYPWQEKEFLIYRLPNPSLSYHLSLFGFPYNRGWQQVSEIVKDTTNFYTSNERDSISRYYIKLKKDKDRLGYYVFLENSQRFENRITNKRVLAWISENAPFKEWVNPSGNKTIIYLIPNDFMQLLPTE